MKEGLSKAKRTSQWALKFSARACYSSLKGLIITLYEFLEEQPEEPSPHAHSVGLTSAGSGTAQADRPRLGDILERQDFGIEQGGDFGIQGTLEAKGGRSTDSIFLPKPTENALDWATSVGFLQAEADVPAEANVPVDADISADADVPAVGGVSGSSFVHGATTDLAVQTCGLS